jgi:hypothetical protein
MQGTLDSPWNRSREQRRAQGRARRPRFWGTDPNSGERLGLVALPAPATFAHFWGQTTILQGTLDTSWNRPGPRFWGQTPIRRFWGDRPQFGGAAWPGRVTGAGYFLHPHFWGQAPIQTKDRHQSKPCNAHCTARGTNLEDDDEYQNEARSSLARSELTDSDSLQMRLIQARRSRKVLLLFC